MPLIRRATTALLIVLTLPILLWPAFLNRWPLIFPDTAAYLDDGREVAAAFLHRLPQPIFWMRSPLYAIVIFPFHLDRTLWPIILLHALCVATTLWLVMRVLLPDPELPYLGIVAALSLITGLSWTTCLVMPDVLGPIAYLSLVMLASAYDRLTLAQRTLVTTLTLWSISAHMTHLMIAAAVCLLLALLSFLPRHHPLVPRSGAIRAALVFGAAVLLQFAVNSWLYQRPTLFGIGRPPYLLARLTADGPARSVLTSDCATNPHAWALCPFVNNISNDSDIFLWDEDGVLAHATPAQAHQMAREETRLLFATLLRHPLEQTRISLTNVSRQLIGFGLKDFSNSPDTDLDLEDIVPGAGARYRSTRQFANTMPTTLFTRMQNISIFAAIVFLCATLPRSWSHLSDTLRVLIVVSLLAILANALLTGALSEVDPRYQVRVAWLIPFLASLVLVARKRVPASEEAGHMATEGSARTADEIPAGPIPA